MSEKTNEDAIQTDLKPCPFCGGSLEITKHFKEEMWRAIHRCPHVGPIQFDWTDRDRIERKWNIRHV